MVIWEAVPLLESTLHCLLLCVATSIHFYALPLKTLLCALTGSVGIFLLIPSLSSYGNSMAEEGIDLNCMDSRVSMFFSSYIGVKDF